MEAARLSPALDYWHSPAENHILILTPSHRVVAMQNSAPAGVLPADVAVDERLARLGAAMLFSADGPLRDLLFEAGILFVTAGGSVSASTHMFEAVFENIAYVILSPLPVRWATLNKPVCTCHVYGVQQQCQHTLFVEGLQPQLPEVITRRDFNVAFSTRAPGRPKGKAKPVAKRRHA